LIIVVDRVSLEIEKIPSDQSGTLQLRCTSSAFSRAASLVPLSLFSITLTQYY
jgi:hypothetical protein